MARKAPFPVAEEDLESGAARSRTYNESPLDARLLDLDEEAESPFLRGQKRVPVRRGALPRKAAGRLKIALVLAVITGCIAVCGIVLYRYATQSWRFRIDSSDNIEILGARNVSRSQIMEVVAGDIDRNIFYVPLETRKKQLEQIPWVQSASVSRSLPDRLRIAIKERTPVAFVEINGHVEMIDAHGVVMEQPAGSQASYSFPVIVGMSETEPLSTRAARMKTYLRLIRELDSDGGHYSHDLSDVDLSDPDDVKATVTDPHGAVLVHLGSSNFLEHFKIYVSHVQEWRAQFPKLQSVSLRYDHQVIVNPDAVASAGNQDGTGAPTTPEAAPGTTAPGPHKKKHP